jgi:hypothetical protein
MGTKHALNGHKKQKSRWCTIRHYTDAVFNSKPLIFRELRSKSLLYLVAHQTYKVES